MNRLFFFIVLFWLIASSRTFGAIGDMFISTTIEGIEMKFAITSEEDKTCEVWGVSWSLDKAIPKETQGVISAVR